MQKTTKKNDATTEYTQDTASQDRNGGLTGAKDQAKKILEKAAHTVEETSLKTANKVSEAYGEIAPTAQQTYDKTAHAVNETYQHTKQYSAENPCKTILIALGIGVGIGFIWASISRQNRGDR